MVGQKTQGLIDKIAPKSIKDAGRRAVKLFVFVFIPLIPYNAITEVDSSVVQTAASAGVCAVFAYLCNLVLNWGSSWDAKE